MSSWKGTIARRTSPDAKRFVRPARNPNAGHLYFKARIVANRRLSRNVG